MGKHRGGKHKPKSHGGGPPQSSKRGGRKGGGGGGGGGGRGGRRNNGGSIYEESSNIVLEYAMAASSRLLRKDERVSMMQEARNTEKHTKWASGRVNLRSKPMVFVGGEVLEPLVPPLSDPGEEISESDEDLDGEASGQNGLTQGNGSKSKYVLKAGINIITSKKEVKVTEASIISPTPAPPAPRASSSKQNIQPIQVQKVEAKNETSPAINDPPPRSPSPATSEERILFVPKKLRPQMKPESIVAPSSSALKQVGSSGSSNQISASKSAGTSGFEASNNKSHKLKGANPVKKDKKMDTLYSELGPIVDAQEDGKEMKDLLELIKDRKLHESFASRDLGEGENSSAPVKKKSRKARRSRFNDNSDEESLQVTPTVAKSRQDFWGPAVTGRGSNSDFDQLVNNMTNLDTTDDIEDDEEASESDEAYLDSSSGISDLEDEDSDEEDLEFMENLAGPADGVNGNAFAAEDEDDDDESENGMDFDPGELLDMVNMVVKPKPNGEFPSASKMADAYDEFDVMDYERPSLQQRHKKGKGKGKAHVVPQDYDADYDLARNLMSAHQADRDRKKAKKATRENYRKLGLLTSKKDGQPDLRAKYPREFTFDNVKTEIKAFLLSEHDSLPLPPMNRNERKEVHLLANRLLLKSKSSGHGDARYTVLMKSEKNKKWENNAVLVESILNSSKSFRNFGTSEHLHQKRRPRDGDEVGEGAAEIGQNNVGRVILEKLGWVAGTGLGAGRDGRVDPVSAYHKVSRHGLG